MVGKNNNNIMIVTQNAEKSDRAFHSGTRLFSRVLKVFAF